MDKMLFEVVLIDGDYANLKRIDAQSEDIKVVARALLPESINEGSKLEYEMFEYTLVE